MGMFQKVNDWLTDKSDRFARNGDANRTANAAYYASSEAEQAYGGMRKPMADGAPTSDTSTAGNETGRTTSVDRFSGDASDKYAGRVPYRSQRDIQAEADTQRQQMEEQARRQQTAQQQRQAQQFGRAPAQAAYQQPQQQGNIVQFPGMIRGPEGNLYAHVEYVVLLRSRNECTKVIEYIKANASVFLNMEFIANDSERQRCVDMLSGAAYTLGCQLNKISQRGIYLISSPSVCVVIDPAMQKYATAPEAQSYIRPEYSGYGGYGAGAQTSAYAAQQGAGGYAAGTRASAYGAQAAASGYTADTRATGYAAQQPNAGGYGTGAAVGARTAAYGAGQGGYTSGARTAAYGTQAGAQTSAYGAQGNAQTSAYPAQPGISAAAPTGAYAAQPSFNAAQTGAYTAAQTGAYTAQTGYPGAQTGAYPAQSAQGFGANAQTGAYPAQRGAGYAAATPANAIPTSAQSKRAMPTFGMQGAFTKSTENGTR